MPELPPTPPSLIAQIRRQEDGPAWAEFLSVYAPVVVGFLRAKGLQDADARDVAQDVFRTVARGIGGFNPAPEKGRFRNWLFVIVRSRLADYWRRASREPQGSGDPEIQNSLVNIAADPDQPVWDQEYGRWLLNWAADRVRVEFADSTWQAFWLTAVEGEPAREVAETLGMNIGNVYVARSRVLARLRDVVRRAEGE